MAVRYNKLWKILIDKKMKKKDLQEAARLTRYQMWSVVFVKLLTALPMTLWSFMIKVHFIGL